MTGDWQGIRACVFDAYGTLFDVHAPAARLRDTLGERADQLSAVWRTKQLEYTWLRSQVYSSCLVRQTAESWSARSPSVSRRRAAGACTSNRVP